MQNLYPLFERNRILKKEMLWSMRDYSFGCLSLEYQQYADGILSGCEVSVRNKVLVIGPGMVKYHGFVSLILEEMTVPYEPSGQMNVLKLRMSESESPDAVAHQLDLVLDPDITCKENEFEVCRFCLREGASLRTDYTDFDDMRTRYDTVNLIDAGWAGIEAATLSPAITRYYAKMILQEESSELQDVTFAWLCFNSHTTVSKYVVEDYLGRVCPQLKLHGGENSELYNALVLRLEEIRRGEKKIGKKDDRKRRIVLE